MSELGRNAGRGAVLPHQQVERGPVDRRFCFERKSAPETIRAPSARLRAPDARKQLRLRATEISGYRCPWQLIDSTFMPTPKLTNEITNAAIDGFESQKRRLDTQIGELRQMLNGGPAASAATSSPKPGRRRMSAAARKRIGDAQRKR